jgi:hypothetical protein
MARRTTDTIPKLDQVSYLFDTLGAVEDGLSFEAIRKELIRLRPESRIPLRARSAAPPFWSNVRDALRELMRLGLINPSALPSRKSQLEAHNRRAFTLTEDGRQFLAIERRDPLEFRHRFAQALLLAHPYMRELVTLLGSRELFFPRIQRADLPGEVDAWRKAPPEPLGQVTVWIAQAVEAVMAITVDPKRLETQMRPYLTAAWKRLDREQKAHLLNKAVVKTFNDVIVRVLLQLYGLRMDYVTFRSAVALLADLNALWDTRSLIDRRGWTIWSTCVAEQPVAAAAKSPAGLSLAGPVWFAPRELREDAIRDALVKTFLSFPDRRGGFALIHVLRAEVCRKLRIHGQDFDRVLRKLHNKTLSDPTYVVNLDRGGGDEMLPSEEPFRIDSRSFYLITLLKRQSEE